MTNRRNLLRLLAACLAAPGAAQEWTSFRGPSGQGIAAAADLPSTFDDTNVLWRVAVGGKGHSSPVLWEERLYLTREGDGSRAVVCIDRASGKEIWAGEQSFETHRQHRFNSFASSTPAVDREGVYLAWTSGSELVALALDHAGERRWRRPLGSFRAQHGSGSSPVLCGDLMIVANDNEGEESFLVALDKDTGKERWRIERRSERASYSSPVVHRPEAGPACLLFASTAHGLTAVEPESGRLLWEADAGFRQRCVATPCVAGNHLILYAGSGSSGKECAVFELPEKAGGPAKALHRPRRSLPYVPSALGLGGRFYLFADGGVASCRDAATGHLVWRERLDGSFFSSPVSDGEVLFIADREGTLYTLAAGDEFRLLGTFELGEPVYATPAISKDRMYVRTFRHLICLGRAKTRVKK